MKLSKRERTLIFILLLAVTVYLGYRFIPYNSIFKLKKLAEEFGGKKSTYDMMSQNIMVKGDYENKLRDLTNEINDINIISDLQQEQLIVFLNNYLEENNIEANNISFTDIAATPLATTLSPTQAKMKSMFENIMDSINGSTENTVDSIQTTEQKPTEEEQLTVKSTTVDLTYNCNYENLLKFIDAIQTNPVDIAITNINTLYQEDNSLQGTMTLNFYTIPKLDDYVELNEDWIWKDVKDTGKSNTLSSDTGSVFSNNIVNGLDSSTSTVSEFDFYMSLKPESSDLPTVILGKADDKTTSTYIYADSNIIEDVEIQFKKENSKYYYKYSTKNNSYPSDGTWLEFVPVGSNINMKIFSSQRSSKADSAGVNINIVNTSNLKVIVTIENDDKSNTRVYFKDPKSVVVTKK